MFIDGEARRLDNEHVSPTYVFHHLYIDLAVRKARHRRLAALHAQKGADLVGQGLIGCAAEDLEFIVHAPALRLWFAFRLHLLLLLLLRLFGCWCYRLHSCSPVTEKSEKKQQQQMQPKSE